LVRGLDDPKHYVHAAQVLLDRGFGKPKQLIEAEGRQDITFLHLTAARAASDALAAEREAAERQLRHPPVIDGEVADKQAATTNLWAPALE
jgi:hypothetical protein